MCCLRCGNSPFYPSQPKLIIRYPYHFPIIDDQNSQEMEGIRRKPLGELPATRINLQLLGVQNSRAVNSKSLTPYVSSSHNNMSSTNECQYYIEDHEDEMEELRMVVHQLEEEVVIKDKEIKQRDVRIKELEERLEVGQNTIQTMKEKISKAHSALDQNQFLTNNNKNLYKSTMRLNEENHRLSSQNSQLQKQVEELNEKLKKYSLAVDSMKKSHKNLLSQHKTIVSENQKDMKQLEVIRYQFLEEKEILLSHIKYLQRVPGKESKKGSSRGIPTETVGEYERLYSEIQNHRMNDTREEKTVKWEGGSKKRRGLSCV